MKRCMRMNDWRIKTRLFIIYLFCVLVPLIVTNIVMLEGVKRSALNEESVEVNHIMERIKYNMATDLVGGMSVVSHIYTDRKVNEFLSKQYESNVEYYNDFTEFLQHNTIRYYYNSQRINEINIYTQNTTLIEGGNFGKIDTVKNTQWYKEFQASGENIYLATYYDGSKVHLPTVSTPRTISLIKRLNYFGEDDIEKIIKVDLSYMAMLRGILNEKNNATIFICNDEEILFSNQVEDHIRNTFTNTSTIDLKKVKYQCSFSMVNEHWTIYIIPEKMNIWRQYVGSNNGIGWLIIINLVIPTLIILRISKSFTSRIELIEAYLAKVEREEFEVIEEELGNDEIGRLIRSYNLMVIKIKNLIEVVFKRGAEAQALQIAKKDAELKALHSQINPHFMFNTLESIRMRSLIKGEEETAHIIGELSIIFRKSLAWDSEYVDVIDEITFIRRYLNLQKYRFGDKLDFALYIMPGCEKIKIPKFCILNFVENACVHGLEKIAKHGSITVTVTRIDERICFEISDSGCGMNVEELHALRKKLSCLEMEQLSKSKNTGMINALIRLNLLYGKDVYFEIESEVGRGTDIILEILLENGVMEV